MTSRRELNREMDDLSEEEQELEELTTDVKNRGFAFLVPIGRLLTQQEEKNDEDEDDDDDDESNGSEESASSDADENESEQDLDADMEDMDDDAANITAETDEMNEGETGDFEEEPSDL